MTAAPWFSVAGGACEFVGLVTLAFDLDGQALRHGGAPSPPRRVLRLVARQVFRRRHTVAAEAGAVFGFEARIEGTVERKAPTFDTLEARIAWIEAEVLRVHERIDGVPGQVDSKLSASEERTAKQIAGVRSEAAELETRVDDLALGGLASAWRGLALASFGVFLSMVGALA